ncbi:hypothetical protein M378DRAFT_77466 [Amanita muscaria Koide BX008]|uniref:Intradiol ring-cleavage dioxygenases domain-containing protein n=1 Tax=Amanita muscaria (strain Koide BX008) TaxID=946122 RepID=A0A0C2SNZ2_AMAMK|nr:hypothetical protein M378DRAFT_77466 [Amanita muscaria Koide BX008]
MRYYLFLSLLAALAVDAHNVPKTDREFEVQRRLQAAAYYCAPAVAQFTADRKRQFTQKVLSGQPELPGYADLFTSYEDAVQSQDNHQELMSCSPVQRESHMKNNNSCVLTPVVTEGPYYHKENHIIRQNIAEYEDGLLLLLDIGVIDVNTCKPLPNVLVDIWQANATGYYAGHPDPRPELINEQPASSGLRKGLRSPYPRTNFVETFLRGAWPTDDRGVAQFVSIFPGYYSGRATHVHTKVFTHWETLSNGTFRSDELVHVGQFFFDDDINAVIDKMYPYSENPIRNTWGRTRNWQDSLNIFRDSHSESPEGKYDPVFKLELLGGVIRQGLVGYITMGINASATYDNYWKS